MADDSKAQIHNTRKRTRPVEASSSMKETQEPTTTTSTTTCLTYVEFYCGVGGWTMALEEAVKRIQQQQQQRQDDDQKNNSNRLVLKRIAALDHSDLCMQVFEHNFGNTTSDVDNNMIIEGDDGQKKSKKKKKKAKSNNNNNSKKPFRIEQLTLEQVEEWKADIWAMSPPCQPHTRQHDNQAKDLQDARSQSFLHLCHLLSRVQHLPKILLVENVIGFETSSSFQTFVTVLESRGYHVGHFHLNPTQMGLPNDRPRYFGVAVQLLLNSTNNTSLESSPLLSYYSSPPPLPSLQAYVRRHPKNTTTKGGKNENDSAPTITIATELPELGIIQEEDNKEGQNNKHMNIRPIADFLLLPAAESALLLRVPEKLLQRNAAWCFDIVTPHDQRSACFTHSYGRFIRGTGSILYDDPTKTSSVTNADNALTRTIQLVAPDQREFQQDWWKALDMDVTKLRYFSGLEMAGLMGFPESFRFPSWCVDKQQWKLMGNSLNVQLAGRMAELGLRLSLAFQQQQQQ